MSIQDYVDSVKHAVEKASQQTVATDADADELEISEILMARKSKDAGKLASHKSTMEQPIFRKQRINNSILTSLAYSMKIPDQQPPTSLHIDGTETPDRNSWNEAVEVLGRQVYGTRWMPGHF